MGNKYVLSRSEFDSKPEALAKIQEWDKKGSLELGKPPFIYQVVKKFLPRRVWQLQEKAVWPTGK